MSTLELTPVPSVAALPPAPDPNDRSSFNTRAYPWSLALDQLSSQLQGVAVATLNNASAVVAAAESVEAAAESVEAAGISDKYRGPYDALVTYALGDVVLYGQQFWIANQSANLGNTPEEGAWWAGVTSNKRYSNATFLNGYTEATFEVPSSSAVEIDLANGSVQRLTTSVSTTVTLPPPAAGKSFQLQLAFGGVHAITWAVSGGGTIKWPDGITPNLTSASGRTDIINFTVAADGTQWFGSLFGRGF